MKYKVQKMQCIKHWKLWKVPHGRNDSPIQVITVKSIKISTLLNTNFEWFLQTKPNQGWQVSASTDLNLGLNRFKPSWQKQVSTRVSATLAETDFCQSFWASFYPKLLVYTLVEASLMIISLIVTLKTFETKLSSLFCFVQFCSVWFN